MALQHRTEPPVSVYQLLIRDDARCPANMTSGMTIGMTMKITLDPIHGAGPPS
jgi:hypothetical protein